MKFLGAVFTGVTVVVLSRYVIQKFASQPIEPTPILVAELESENGYA